jgi:hypothetical protein
LDVLTQDIGKTNGGMDKAGKHKDLIEQSKGPIAARSS